MQLARDELQTTMIAETNRKRRKLERDRRAAERPQPGESTTTLCNYLRRVNFKQCFVSPPFHTRSLFRQHSTRLSTKTHKALPPVVVARDHWRHTAHTLPYLHYRWVKSPMTLITSSTIDGRLNLYRRVMIHLYHQLPQV